MKKLNEQLRVRCSELEADNNELNEEAENLTNNMKNAISAKEKLEIDFEILLKEKENTVEVADNAVIEQLNLKIADNQKDIEKY